MNYQELEKYLFEISDEKFASFSKSLSNSEYISIGVKNPTLKSIIKEHKNDENLRLEDFVLGKYLEVDFIYFGLAISRLKTSEEQLDFLYKNVKLIKSWAVTDTIPSFLKKFSFEQFEDFFFKSYKSKFLYQRRMAYVLGLKYYKDKRILNLLDKFSLNEEYMVMMAEAWLLSFSAIYFENEIFNYLKSIDDIKLKRKTISKIVESFRFINKSKEKFKSLR